MPTTHTTHTTLSMPTSQAGDILADLTTAVAPQCERHFDTASTHVVDGTDYTRVSWPVRPQVAAALLALARGGDYPDLSVTPSTTPYADITYPPLPAEGETCEGEQIYDTGDGFVFCRQTHPRGINAPEDVPALFALYREGGDLTWSPDNELIRRGQIRTVDGVEWRALQEHRTQANRKPGEWAAGWVRVEMYDPETGPTEWAVGIQWAADDLCIYQGQVYVCVIPHTSFGVHMAPDVYQAGWDPV